MKPTCVFSLRYKRSLIQSKSKVKQQAPLQLPTNENSPLLCNLKNKSVFYLFYLRLKKTGGEYVLRTMFNF